MSQSQLGNTDANFNEGINPRTVNISAKNVALLERLARSTTSDVLRKKVVEVVLPTTGRPARTAQPSAGSLDQGQPGRPFLPVVASRGSSPSYPEIGDHPAIGSVASAAAVVSVARIFPVPAATSAGSTASISGVSDVPGFVREYYVAAP